MELLENLGAFGLGIILAISAGGLFWKLDDAIAEAPREALSRFLRRLSLEPPYPNIPGILNAAFNRIFTEKHISWRCFFMSCVFSILMVALLTVVFSYRTKLHDPGLTIPIGWQNLAVLGFGAVLLNLFPDYISLLKTRLMVRFMSRTQRFSMVCGYLSLDFLLTLAIFVGWLALLIIIGYFAVAPDSTSTIARAPQTLSEQFAEGLNFYLSKGALTLSGIEGIGGIFLYSTYFTSVWVWLTALGWGAIRLMAIAPPLLRAMQYLLPIETHPLRSIGEVAALIVCLGYWGVATVTWITSTPEAQAALGN